MGEGRKAETDRDPAVSMSRTSPWIERPPLSALRSGGAPAGIRKPVKYQFEGRTPAGNRSDARSRPASGPIKSRFRAWTRRLRTSREVAGMGSGRSVGHEQIARRITGCVALIVRVTPHGECEWRFCPSDTGYHPRRTQRRNIVVKCWYLEDP